MKERDRERDRGGLGEDSFTERKSRSQRDVDRMASGSSTAPWAKAEAPAAAPPTAPAKAPSFATSTISVVELDALVRAAAHAGTRQLELRVLCAAACLALRSGLLTLACHRVCCRQVVLKIIKHCQQALPAFVTGQLLGLDVGPTLEVTNSFPFPGKESVNGESSAMDDDASSEYQIEMMRCLREVNVDNNTVGWYQSTYFSSFIDEQCVETQFNYQSNLKNCVVLIFDPSRARTSGIALRAFRLTDSFMTLYSVGKVTYDALAGASSTSKRAGVFEEVPIKVRSSHLSSALLLELQDECGFSANAADFSRLELNTNPFLEKQLQLLIECIEDLQQESSKLQHYERAVQRQKGTQSSYLAKKKAEAVARRARGEEPLPEEDLTHNSLFKPIAKPSRLESLLITDQMSAYCQQINQFTGQSFAKLFLLQSLNNGADKA